MTSAAPFGLLQALQGGDPLRAIQSATAAALPSVTPQVNSTLAVYDPYYKQLDPDCSGRYLELHLKDPRQALPAGNMSFDGADWLAPFLLACDTVVVPVIYNKGGYRWSGRVDVAHDKSSGGVETVVCELVGDKTWLDRILCWPAPELPIFIQEPGEWFAIGPGLTVIAALIQEQAWRLQLHLWSLVNDVTSLDFAGFLADLFGTDKSIDLAQALVTPICVIGPNGFDDTSAWIEINGRMDTVWKLVQQQLIDNGFDIDATMWIPGDPQPAGISFELTLPTCVITLVDRSGFTGPWGPFEGLAVDLTQLAGSILGNVLNPLLNPQNIDPYLSEDLGEYVAPSIGVNFTPPTLYFNLDAAETGLIDFTVSHHAPLARQVVIGGQSPKWITDLIDLLLEWLVDAVTIALGVTGIPNTLLDGIFDNVLFAFSVVENTQTEQTAGPFVFPEKFFPSGEGALTIDTVFSEKSALWNVRGYPSGQIKFIDNQPFAVGREIFRGLLVFYIRRGKLYIDYCEEIDIDHTRGKGLTTTLQIGDGKAEESAMTKSQRKVMGLETFLNIFFSGGNLG